MQLGNFESNGCDYIMEELGVKYQPILDKLMGKCELTILSS